MEMQGELAADMGYLRKLCTLSAMAEEGIETIVNARCKAINETGVVAERDGEELTIPCDTVVTAVGARSKPCDELKAACERLGIKYYVIGDARTGTPRPERDGRGRCRRLRDKQGVKRRKIHKEDKNLDF